MRAGLQHRRPTILVTGASGVVGRALLPRLTGYRVICLAHRTSPGAGESIVGDLTAADLGLALTDYRRLAGSVQAVVHAAAVTNFADPDVHRVNVDGTARVCALVQDSGAHLLHVSTAFVDTGAEGTPGASLRYAASKREAESLVRQRVPGATIARPSIVVGDSTTGRIARYQGVYQVAGAVLTGQLPVAPVDPAWILDLVPQDLVAEALVRLVDGRGAGQVHWLTTGERSLTLAAAAEVLVDLARCAGSPVGAPRFVDPDLYHRLIAPALLPSLPPQMRTSLETMMDHLSAYMSLSRPFPTSMPAILGERRFRSAVPPDVLRRCMSVWAADRGIPGHPVDSPGAEDLGGEEAA